MDGIINGDGEAKKFCGRVTDSLAPLLSVGQRILVRYVSNGRAVRTENNFRLTYVAGKTLFHFSFLFDLIVNLYDDTNQAMRSCIRFSF